MVWGLNVKHPIFLALCIRRTPNMSVKICAKKCVLYGKQYFTGTVNGLLLPYYLINIVVNSHFYGSGQSLMNDNFTVVSIVQSAFKEWNGIIQYFLK